MTNETQLAAAVLASMGVKDYDPKVTGLLAEYLRRKCCRCCCREDGRGERGWREREAVEATALHTPHRLHPHRTHLTVECIPFTNTHSQAM
jgi:hypothetical protein